MSGQNGQDEAARLEQALARIARAAARRASASSHTLPSPSSHALQEAGVSAGAGGSAALRDAAAHATNPGSGPDTAEIAARLDSLIAELRTLLGP